MSKPDEIAARMVADAFEQRKSTPARREYLRLAIAAALTAERERTEAYRIKLASRDASMAAVLKADGVDYTDELSAWMQLAAAYRAERTAREKAEAETLAVLRREAETTARIDARLDKEAAKARAAALREAHIRVLEQRCERNTPYDMGIVIAANAILSLIPQEAVDEAR